MEQNIKGCIPPKKVGHAPRLVEDQSRIVRPHWAAWSKACWISSVHCSDVCANEKECLPFLWPLATVGANRGTKGCYTPLALNNVTLVYVIVLSYGLTANSTRRPAREFRDSVDVRGTSNEWSNCSPAVVSFFSSCLPRNVRRLQWRGPLGTWCWLSSQLSLWQVYPSCRPFGEEQAASIGSGHRAAASKSEFVNVARTLRTRNMLQVSSRGEEKHDTDEPHRDTTRCGRA